MSIRTTFVLMVMLILVAGYFIFENTPEGTGDATSQPPWFYTVSTNDISEITVKHKNMEETFKNTAAGWVIEQPQELPVDESRWSGVTLLLSGPKTERIVHETVEDLSLYGLEKPQTIIDVTLLGNRTIRTYLGDLTPDGTAHYVMQENDSRLYTIDTSWGQVMTNLAAIPPKPPWYYDVLPQTVDYISVTHEENEIAFDKGFDNVWKFADREGKILNQEQWQDVIPKLGGPAELIILKNRITTEEFTTLGLLKPETIIQVEYTHPDAITEYLKQVLIMEIGNAIPDNSAYYAKVDGQPYLLSVDARWYEAIRDLALDPPTLNSSNGN
ncbi:DUF4340 domain-containing protein [SAR202 cluster bacterium AD-802-E10_MRT_200m]|nr:DUF4340 domain-containing protein [SAR202 cluster bacterium AD-802-E10_MRT_200m]